MDKNNIFKELEINDINPNLLKKINRFQRVERYYKKIDGNWVIKSTNYSVDWSDWKRKEILGAIVHALNNGGNVIGHMKMKN